MNYWDEVIQSTPDYQFAQTREYEFLVTLLARNSESIFEASVGTGIIPHMLRNYAGWTGNYVGSDYVDSFLKQAERLNPGENFIKADLLETLPFANNRFDCSVVHHGLEYVYPYEKALRELQRVTKRYVFVCMWIPLMGEDNIRFNEQGGWNVNYYDSEKFLSLTGQIFGYPVMEAKILNENGKTNYWYVFNAQDNE